MNQNKTIVVSGGFDVAHSGHTQMFHSAALYGNLVVVINSDEWLIRKKGFYLLDWKERANIISLFPYVSDISAVDDEDGSVCEALRRIVPNYFANGGDRTERNTPEKVVCDELGIQTIYGVGGEEKMNSSTDCFINALRMAKENGRLEGYLNQL